MGRKIVFDWGRECSDIGGELSERGKKEAGTGFLGGWIIFFTGKYPQYFCGQITPSPFDLNRLFHSITPSWKLKMAVESIFKKLFWRISYWNETIQLNKYTEIIVLIQTPFTKLAIYLFV